MDRRGIHLQYPLTQPLYLKLRCLVGPASFICIPLYLIFMSKMVLSCYLFTGEDLTMNKDGGIIRTVLQKGAGSSSPNMRSLVKVDISGYCDDKLFDKRELTFTVGDGFDHQIPDGVERAVRKMKKGEKSSLSISAKYGFGSKGCERFDIDANSPLKYEVHLLEFTKVCTTSSLKFDVVDIHAHVSTRS